jgi:small subunit ribosomal protein S7
MPRRKAAVKREVLPDPLYGSQEISRFINVVMRAGKKSIAERIVYSALDMLTTRLKKEKDASAAKGKTHSKDEVLDALNRALGNIAPTVEVKSRRVGGATYQVPIEVASDRGRALAMRWLAHAAEGRPEKTMADRLSAEMYDATLGRGASIKTRDDVHRMAKANQAFAHYRW